MMLQFAQEQCLLLGKYLPLTTDQYHEMIKKGIIPDGAPIGLLDGLLALDTPQTLVVLAGELLP